MSQRQKQVTMYKLTYVTPGGNEKWLYWRGKDERHAANSWLRIAAKGTKVIDMEPYTIKWKY